LITETSFSFKKFCDIDSLLAVSGSVRRNVVAGEMTISWISGARQGFVSWIDLEKFKGK